MRLSLSEIRQNAMRFAAEWQDVASERAEAQTFWNDLFAVFGVKRRHVAAFEEKVRSIKGTYSRIDVFYTGVMIGEHKSRGEDLSAAASQAFEYVRSLIRDDRAAEAPQYIVVSDFQTIAIYDLDSPDASAPIAEFPTSKLHDHIRHLGFLSGYVSKPVDPEDPINIDAVEVLGELHDALEKGGYTGHQLERFLVRVLFCLFADDTQIFENEEFKQLVKESRTDGSDLGPILDQFFRVLDQPKPQRSRNLTDELLALPYVNGELFRERLDFAAFDGDMRDALIECCDFNWSRISPAVFGSLFQSIMAGEEGKKKRRQIGAHYTSERDIMKVVRSLFLDDLQAELEACGTSKRKLERFHDKLASLKFLDPACGCGNFLVVTYRELRELELEVLLRLHRDRSAAAGAAGAQRVLDLDHLLRVQVDQMHGIEIEEWPARIAEVAMWLIDHQMNQRVGEAFGQPVFRLPLVRSAKIAHANALRIDWNDVLPAEECSFVLGNPPFVGHSYQSKEQKSDQAHVWREVKGSGVLDFVTCWYAVAAAYIQSTQVGCAFVSTNSISQGEQPGIFWPYLFANDVKIDFAHRTFAWESEARGKAHVHVVIIGFSAGRELARVIIDYDTGNEDVSRVVVANISPYLIEGPDFAINNRTKPLCKVPKMSWGNKPTDGGHLILSPPERDDLLASEPQALPFVRPYMSGGDFINGIERYCLWLKDADPALLRRCPLVLERVAAVRETRLKSKAASTRAYAEYPTLFRQIAQPDSDYLAIPEVSSERRDYVPIAFISSEVICSNKIQFIPEATSWLFGVLTSSMHMAWMRQVCGRLESRISYSNTLVYNNFPWPQGATDAQRAKVEQCAQAVLDAREAFPGQTLADLYDPLAMPKLLRDAHKALDRAVDLCYRKQPFTSERERVEFLFGMYQQLVTPLTASAGKKKARKKARKKKAAE